MPLTYLAITLLAVINLISFIIMAVDKRRSIQGGNIERIPEGVLFFLGAAFGGVGVYAGMLLLQHKTRKWYFVIGVPLLIIQNLATSFLIYSHIV